MCLTFSVGTFLQTDGLVKIIFCGTQQQCGIPQMFIDTMGQLSIYGTTICLFITFCLLDA